MDDILKQLFEGELKLNFQNVEDVPEYKAARQEIMEKEVPFRAELTPLQVETYEALQQKSLAAEYILTVEAFRRGFSTAVRLLAEAITRQPDDPGRN